VRGDGDVKLIPLLQVRAQLRSGAPLPWNVRDADGKLLLARGLLVADEAMLLSLLERGMFVDADEARANGRSDPVSGPAQGFFDRWNALQARLATLLRNPGDPGFVERIRDCARLVASLTERHTDPLIYAIVRHDHSRFASYGSVHSLHVAAVCSLLARRMGWSEERHACAVCAALTMNLSIIELQGHLAARGEALTPAQREAIHVHPQASAQLLREAGLADETWLAAVEQHHEQPEGRGYPNGLQAPGELSQMLRYVDIFTAKHAPRAARPPLPPQQAARELYTGSGAHPVAALLIKEFGIFPPGCFVKLSSGETAIVVRRGSSANAPLAAAITNRNGDALAAPLRRDTSQADFAIVNSLIDRAVLVQVTVDKLYVDL
jgi:HD-GYP domain-containing protein (c-di-GMP phosphodiesterase class II)